MTVKVTGLYYHHETGQTGALVIHSGADCLPVVTDACQLCAVFTGDILQELREMLWDCAAGFRGTMEWYDATPATVRFLNSVSSLPISDFKLKTTETATH